MIWKDVKGYEGYYQVSDTGLVKSLDRYVTTTKGKRLVKGKIIKISKDRMGYLFIELNKDGKGIKKKIHRLVAEAFIESPSNKHIVNHIDGNKANNNIQNLEWVTHKENTLHALKTGLNTNIGEGARDNILTEKQVLDIRSNHTDSYDKLANIYKVSKSTIADIKKFRSWKWLEGEKLIYVTEMDKKIFPSKVRSIRKTNKMTVEQFAKELGVTASTVNRWEKGKIFPKDVFLRVLMDKFGLKLETK